MKACGALGHPLPLIRILQRGNPLRTPHQHTAPHQRTSALAHLRTSTLAHCSILAHQHTCTLAHQHTRTLAHCCTLAHQHTAHQRTAALFIACGDLWILSPYTALLHCSLHNIVQCNAMYCTVVHIVTLAFVKLHFTCSLHTATPLR